MSSNVLARIVADKAAQNRQQAAEFPLQDYQAKLTPSDRSLHTALSKPQAGFILECKKASPSKGLIRANFNPVELARLYQPYAAAISVLTEPQHFQGQLAYLTAVRAAVHQPILCKDFFVDTEQVYRARYFGADAILLMLSVLDDHTYRELAAVAERLQLDVLTEVASAEEMQRASNLGANIIGINNRDLTTLEIDPERSQRLSALAPENALLIAESGFSNHQAVRLTSPYVNGFLVGSALSAQENVDAACRSLIYGDNKVCGLMREADALNAYAHGARFGGLIFAEHSPRALTAARAHQIVAAAPQLDYVGVFANQSLASMVTTAQQLNLAAIQLHGNESVGDIDLLRQQLDQSGLAQTQIWRALRINKETFKTPLPAPSTVDRWLLDNGSGGTGRTFDWNLLAQQQHIALDQCLLAGGIAADNAVEALQYGVTGVDSSSRLEQQSGQKNVVRIAELFQTIRHYGRFSQRYSSNNSAQEAV